ncbi:hypothetical protein AeMF1_012871, partial [Aphanomyces euteiches]
MTDKNILERINDIDANSNEGTMWSFVVNLREQTLKDQLAKRLDMPAKTFKLLEESFT